jgi:hypothetical protein
MNSGLLSKKQAHCQPDDPAEIGDMWVWRAMALPSRLRVLSHLSHERSEAEATAFLARLKARTDGCAPFFTSDQLPAYVAALIANYSTPQPSPRQRGPGRPRKAPPRVVDPHLRYAQVNKRRAGGRVVEVKRHIVFGSEDDLIQILETDGCGSQINTSYSSTCKVRGRTADQVSRLIGHL